MKTRYTSLFISSLFFALNAFAGGGGEKALWTTMLSGGTNNLGVIYSVNPDGSNGTVAINFSGTNGANPSGNLVQGPGGRLFGTTMAGGAHNYGVLFSYDPNNTLNPYRQLHDFNSADGASPKDLVLAADGKIYGTTQAGGANSSATAPEGSGVIYSYDPATQIFAKLFDFDGNKGENPEGLMQASDGKLYGMTRQGGYANNGVLYSYTPGDAATTSLLDFNSFNGGLPTNCKLIQANDGKLYGMTTWGGDNNMGVLFSYDLQFGYTKLFDFNGITGSYPSSSLLQANNGVLYGVSLYGGTNDVGVLFKYNINTTSYANLYNFNGTQGSVPFGSLIQASDNLLYGMTTKGGTNGTGVIYDYNINNDAFTVLRDCDGAGAGGTPMSNLIEIRGTTGIENINTKQVSLFPNPTTNKIVIQSGDFNPELTTIYDIEGHRISESKFVKYMDVTSLNAGIYFVEVKNGTDFVRTKLIKE